MRSKSIKIDIKSIKTRLESRYGNNLSILLQKPDNNYIHLEDLKCITKSQLYTFVPKMIDKKNIVIILEYIDNNLEVMAVHHPRQSNLTTLPPIFF
jgi:hypothetical protein